MCNYPSADIILLYTGYFALYFIHAIQENSIPVSTNLGILS